MATFQPEFKRARDLRLAGLKVPDFIPDKAVVKQYSEYQEKPKSRVSVRAWCIWVVDGKPIGSLVEGVIP